MITLQSQSDYDLKRKNKNRASKLTQISIDFDVSLSLFITENVCGRGTQQIFDGAIQVASPMASPHNYNKFKKKQNKNRPWAFFNVVVMIFFIFQTRWGRDLLPEWGPRRVQLEASTFYPISGN